MRNPLRLVAVRSVLVAALCAQAVYQTAYQAAHADEATDGTVEEALIVTGARIPTPLDRFDGAATVITARDIRLHQYRDLGDALASVPGLHVSSSGGAGARTSVFIRGAESNHVLVLIDGVEAADPGSGLFAFEHLQLNDVERVEVLRGPYGAHYGSEGIGGVINVVTKRGRGEPRASARVETGSFETDAAAVNLSGRRDRVDFSFGGAWLETDGESFTPRRLRAGSDEERDGYRNLDLKSAVGVELGGQSRVDMSFGYVDANAEYDGFSNPFEQPGLRDSTREKRYSARWSGATARGAWRPSLRGSRYERDYAAPGGYATRAKRTRFEWRNDLSWSDEWRFIVGAETEIEEFNAFSARTAAVYLQARYVPFEALSLSAGWRNDDPDDFGSDRSWRVAAVWAWERAGVRWRASYGTAFKAPTLFDRFDPLYGNPDLDPETSRSWETGVEQTFRFDETSSAGWGATYFNGQVRRLIEPVIDSDLQTFFPANVASARTEGVEAFAFLKPAERASLRLDYTVTRAHDGTRRRLLRRPLRKASLRAGWTNASAWSLAATLDYVGPQHDLRRDTFTRTGKGGYVLAHVAARRRINAHLSFFARVDNVFDRDYEPVDGYAGTGVEVRAGFEVGL